MYFHTVKNTVANLSLHEFTGFKVRMNKEFVTVKSSVKYVIWLVKTWLTLGMFLLRK